MFVPDQRRYLCAHDYQPSVCAPRRRCHRPAWPGDPVFQRRL